MLFAVNDWVSVFQPTLPARGATLALLVCGACIFDFNPRSPHGERLRKPTKAELDNVFQPTLPARGATEAPWAQRRRE